MNGETGFLHSFGAVGCLRIQGELAIGGRIFVPQTSHEGSWCQASIALPNHCLTNSCSRRH